MITHMFMKSLFISLSLSLSLSFVFSPSCLAQRVDMEECDDNDGDETYGDGGRAEKSHSRGGEDVLKPRRAELRPVIESVLRAMTQVRSITYIYICT